MPMGEWRIELSEDKTPPEKKKKKRTTTKQENTCFIIEKNRS